MRRKQAMSLAAALLLAAAFWGCSESPSTPAIPPANTVDAGLVDEALIAATAVVDDDLSGSESALDEIALVTGDAAKTAIVPKHFWRRIRSVTRTLEFAFSDSDSTDRPLRAVVTVRKRLLGSFNILPVKSDSSEAADTLKAISKPLDDRWTRRVLLLRVPARDDSTRSVWRVAAVSGVDVRTAGRETRIESLRVQAAGVDTTITDPLAFQWLRRSLHFAPQDSVRLTVTTLRDDDVVLFHHHGHRARFRNNGDGSHTLAFVSGVLPGWRHFGVSALSHGTLFDDALPYDANRWHLPFFTVPEVPLDF